MNHIQHFWAALGRFFGWVRITLDTLCDRPDHLQRLSIIGSGMAAFPLLVWVIRILVDFGMHGPDTQAALAVIPIIGLMGGGIIFLYALSQVALLGIIKGVRLSGPGGLGVEIETTSGEGQSQRTTITQPPALPGEAPTGITVTQTPAEPGSGAAPSVTVTQTPSSSVGQITE